MKPKSTKEKLGGCAGLKPVRCNGLKHHMKHRDVTRLAVYLATYNDWSMAFMNSAGGWRI